MASRTQILNDMARVFTTSDPVTIQAAITDFCFNKCFMCDHFKREDKTYINLGHWQTFLRSLKDTKTIFYTGGDSMMHPQINEIMQEHINLDIDFGFITTGFIPKDIDMRLLKKAKFFNVSLDSVDPENYEKIRGGIALEKVIDSIEYAIDSGVNVNATVVLSDKNVDEMDKIIGFCYKRKMDLRINHLYGKEPIEIDYGYYSSKFADAKLSLTYKQQSFEFKKCVVPYYSMFIDSRGSVYPCCVLGGDTEIDANVEPLGSIFDFKTAKANREEFYKQDLPQKCSNCLSSFQKINNTFECDITINLEIKESRNFY